ARYARQVCQAQQAPPRSSSHDLMERLCLHRSSVLTTLFLGQAVACAVAPHYNSGLGGRSPPLDDALLPPGPDPHPPVAMPTDVPADSLIEQQLRQACARLDRQLRSGHHCDAESLFAEFPSLAEQTDSALELIYAEFCTREELGQEPNPEDYYRRFPL